MKQITNLMKAFFPMNNGWIEDDDVLWCLFYWKQSTILYNLIRIGTLDNGDL